MSNDIPCLPKFKELRLVSVMNSEDALTASQHPMVASLFTSTINYLTPPGVILKCCWMVDSNVFTLLCNQL
jgi:hypothetical protein